LAAPTPERILVQHVEGGPDLVCLHRSVHSFLCQIDDLVVAEAILVTVVLVGDAFRYGVPPVILGLRFLADRCRLRIIVDDQQPFSPGSRPRRDRGGGLLDRLASDRGLGPTGNGGTRAWVDLAVIPSNAALRRAKV
jgi:hypothetical protein